jgi:hypothetical protein
MAEERQRDPRGHLASSPDDGDEDSGDGRPEHGPGERHVEDISDTPAPSIGPHTTFEKIEPSQRPRGEASDVDAMGMDKRRQVTGGTYGPTRARQLTLYGIFIAVVIALAIGFKLLADELDQPPETNRDVAPWTGTDREPRPLQ